jgi:uncharacterized protein YqjF (DUF2071 family)
MREHDDIDRVSPMLEPDQRPLMIQTWETLLFLHWPVPVAELQQLLPADLTIDTFEGKAYVSIVPFVVREMRPSFTPPIPGLSSMNEVNVRTYVHRRGADPGVWFFSLDASNAIVAAAARTAYRLPYVHADIAIAEGEGGVCSLDLNRAEGHLPGAVAHLSWTPEEGGYGAPAPGSLDSFLLNRYILYTEDEHTLYRARVHHAPPLARRATVGSIEETLTWAAGVKRPPTAPIAHSVQRVQDVKIYAPELCRA